MKSAFDNSDDRQIWAINGRFLCQPVTGVQRYAREILAGLDDLLSMDGFGANRIAMRLAVPPQVEEAPGLKNIGFQRTGIGSGHAWDQFVLPFHAEVGVLSLGNFGPLLARRHIVCIHDANTFVFPESYSRAFGLSYRTLLPLVGRRASRVATVSQFSASMLVKYGICDSDKIFVAPNGHEHVLRWDARRARLPLLDTLKRPYVLLLGSAARHKNVDIVLQQAQALDAAGIDLVVTGAASSIFATVAAGERRPNIHYTGFVGDDELAALYGRALCLVFPSKTEGFGIPPLEAMAMGCPVISSNAASLVEVGGDAVIYVDPDDGTGWMQAIVGLSGNLALRASMSEKGKRRSGLFAWRRSAEIYLNEILRLS